MTSGKTDVHLFLFTDHLLICKKSTVSSKKSSSGSLGPVGDKFKVIRPPYSVDRLIPVASSDHHTSDSNLTSKLHHSSSSSSSHSHHNHLAVLYINEFGVASSLLTFYCQDAKELLDGIRKAQKRYQEAKLKAVLANYNYLSPNSISMYRTMDDDDSEGTSSGYIVNYINNNNNPQAVNLNQDASSSSAAHQPVLLLTSSHFHSSGRSSRSSLMPSYSGSMEMSEGATTPSFMGSNLQIIPPAPAVTPNLYYVMGGSHNQASHQSKHLAGHSGQTSLDETSMLQNHPSRARSFELGDLRNPSLSVDNEAFGRSHSMETRSSVCVTITSPRPERRAFLLRGSGSGSPYSSCNTLNVPTQRVLVPQTQTTKVTSVSVQTSDPLTTVIEVQPKPVPPSRPSSSHPGSQQQPPPPPPPRTPVSRTSSVGPQTTTRSQTSTVVSPGGKPPPPKVPPRKTPPQGSSQQQAVLTRCLSPVNKPPLVKTKNIVPPSPPSPSISLKQGSSDASHADVTHVTDTPGLLLLSYKKSPEEILVPSTETESQETVVSPSPLTCSTPSTSLLHQKRSTSRQEKQGRSRFHTQDCGSIFSVKDSDHKHLPVNNQKQGSQQKTPGQSSSFCETRSRSLHHHPSSSYRCMSSQANQSERTADTNPFISSSHDSVHSSSGISTSSSGSTHFPFCRDSISRRATDRKSQAKKKSDRRSEEEDDEVEDEGEELLEEYDEGSLVDCNRFEVEGTTSLLQYDDSHGKQLTREQLDSQGVSSSHSRALFPGLFSTTSPATTVANVMHKMSSLTSKQQQHSSSRETISRVCHETSSPSAQITGKGDRKSDESGASSSSTTAVVDPQTPTQSSSSSTPFSSRQIREELKKMKEFLLANHIGSS